MENQTQQQEVEFISELNKLVQANWKHVAEFIKTTSVKICDLSFAVEPTEEMLTKYGLNKDVKFIANATPDDSSMKYYYKNAKLDPNCYYIRPDNHRTPTTLEILQECIKQDTHSPDIKHLEVPANETN